MPALFEYMLKMSLCLAAIYLFYHFALRRITHYQWNRLFLLAYTLLAFVLPAININAIVQPEKLQKVFFVRDVPTISAVAASSNPVEVTTQSNWWFWISLIFIAGAAILLIKLLVQLFSLKLLQQRSLPVKMGTVKLYDVQEGIAPFSFHQSIYLDKNAYDDNELKEIIQHELVHVQQKHTIDVMLAEFICICNWYNPFAWLLKKAIKENLEFIADEQVLNTGVDHKSYQYLLLKVGGNMPLRITNSLNFSSLKKRIYMMNKTRTGNAHLLKFLFVIPVVCILLVAFRDQSSGRTPQMKERSLLTAESFSVGKLAYFISDPAVEAIVKKDQANSLLQPGGELTLTLMQNEKSRLKALLEKNGYSNLNSQSITFMMDTSFSSKNFSIKIIIDLPNARNAARKMNSSIDGKSFEMTEVKENNQERVAFSTHGEKDNTRMVTSPNNDDETNTLNEKFHPEVK